MKRMCLIVVALVWGILHAETNVIDGVTYVCEDGICRMLTPAEAPATNATRAVRMVQGYQNADEFLAFLEDRPQEDVFAGKGVWLILLLTLLGGLAMNLTPCVLPMIPINLLIIGKSARRGLSYGLGIVIAYGTLGLLASVGGLAFGHIQANPWFNLAVALVFALLAASLFGAFGIDATRFRAGFRGGAFLMGALAAVLAGACVAPILIAVLLLTARLFAAGKVMALALPFVLGIGMALPWPLVGAGLSVLPKPGAWMVWVNRLFGLVVTAFAIGHLVLAWRGFRPVTEPAQAREHRQAEVLEATLATFDVRLAACDASRPILVDCWASWCKNCHAMEHGTMKDPRVTEALKGFTVIRLQAEDMGALRRLPGFEGVLGLPAFVILKDTKSPRPLP